MESMKSGVGFIIEAIHLSSSDMQKSFHQIWRYFCFATQDENPSNSLVQAQPPLNQPWLPTIVHR